MLLALPAGFGLILIGLWLFCIFDVIATDESLARNLPKTLWLLIVIFLPSVGSLAWLIMGRPLNAGWRPGDTTPRGPRAARGPEDLPSWSPPSRPPAPPAPTPDPARLQAWEDDLIRRERELRRPSPEPPPDDAPPDPGYRW